MFHIKQNNNINKITIEITVSNESQSKRTVSQNLEHLILQITLTRLFAHLEKMFARWLLFHAWIVKTRIEHNDSK